MKTGLTDTLLNEIFRLSQKNRRLTIELARARGMYGLVPICASCKQIRERDHWTSVEAYVAGHSDAQFSHTICPTCIRELYPQCAA